MFIKLWTIQHSLQHEHSANCTFRIPASCFDSFHHCCLWLGWTTPNLCKSCKSEKRPQIKTLWVRHESLPTFYCLMRSRAAGSCCQQSFCIKQNKQCQMSTPCCDDCSDQWCPQVKGSPSGLEVEAGKSLFFAWRGPRHKRPVNTIKINIYMFVTLFLLNFALHILNLPSMHILTSHQLIKLTGLATMTTQSGPSVYMFLPQGQADAECLTPRYAT